MTNYNNLTIKQLQQLCKDRGILTKGRKNELIDKLTQHDNGTLDVSNMSKVFLYLNDTTNTNNDKVEKNDNEEVSRASTEVTTTNDIFSTSSLDLMSSMLGLDDQVSDDTVTQQEFKPTNTNKVIIPKPIKVVSDNATRAFKYFSLNEAYSTNGFFCLNTNAVTTGIDAQVILNNLYQLYPVLEQYTDNILQGEQVKVLFGLAKEVEVTKKVVKKGRNNLPSVVEYGDKPRSKTVYVQNDRGNDLGLPSEKRSPYKSGLKNAVIDHRNVVKLYVGNKLVYPVDNGNIKVLPSQAYNATTGKSREHKDKCGYVGKTHNAKNKMSTGVKLTSTVQKNIDHRLLSPIFKLQQFKYPVQIQVTSVGHILLREYHPSGMRVIGMIGKITGHYEQTTITGEVLRQFQWTYSLDWDIKSEQLEKQIRRHLSKCNIDIIVFLSKRNDHFINEDGQVKKLSKCRRKAIAKQQANTTNINKKGIVSLISASTK